MSGAVGQTCPVCGRRIQKGELVVFKNGQWQHEEEPPFWRVPQEMLLPTPVIIDGAISVPPRVPMGMINVVKVPVFLYFEEPTYRKLGKEEIIDEIFNAIRSIHWKIGFIQLKEIDVKKSTFVEERTGRIIPK